MVHQKTIGVWQNLPDELKNAQFEKANASSVNEQQ